MFEIRRDLPFGVERERENEVKVEERPGCGVTTIVEGGFDWDHEVFIWNESKG